MRWAGGVAGKVHDRDGVPSPSGRLPGVGQVADQQLVIAGGRLIRVRRAQVHQSQPVMLAQGGLQCSTHAPESAGKHEQGTRRRCVHLCLHSSGPGQQLADRLRTAFSLTRGVTNDIFSLVSMAK